MTGVGNDALRECSLRIGYEFRNIDFLRTALIHRSWQAEHDEEHSNERVEFLGDAVLGWAVADIAYHRLEGMHEGKLTDLRISVVNMNALAERARTLGIGEFVFLGKGEDAAGGRDKQSILSDTFEAIIGAVYLDGGASVAFEFVRRMLGGAIEEAIPNLEMFDAKSRLQEMCSRLGAGAPRYVTVGEGPDHERVYTSTVHVDGRAVGQGSGRTKKAAEQAAAVEACDVLRPVDDA